MKKLAIILVLSLFAMTACGTETLSQADVLGKSIEAVENLESYSVEMDMVINMMEMETSMTLTGDVTHNPDAMYLEMNMGIPGMSMDIEAYALEETVYMSVFGEWLKVDASEMGLEDFDQLNQEEMQKLLEFSEEFTMEEKEDVYILTLSGEGDEYSILIEDYLKSGMGDFNEDPQMEEMMEAIQVNNFNMEIHIDKKTFMQTAQVFNADLLIEEAGVGIAMPVNMSGNVKMTNVNGVAPIEIPEEVKESAVEEDAAFLDFDAEGFELFGEYQEMSVEEIQEIVDYDIPEIHGLPEGYELTESIYDEAMEMVMLSYEKDVDNGLMLSIVPIDNDPFFDQAFIEGEEVTVNGKEATLLDMGFFISLSWEQDGLLFELAGSGDGFTSETILEIAENLE
ncbi:DUF4367 domain-containing protein [Halalkalibacter okhensis]|uniref:DUF4367 domain-containing protein n=1 Tax=Halalkalibacter okhensis TaxID=333138 RepID=A0A0B0IGF4_9BACI|nr:DUF4367 domain-containing protein [Halalkalibacter okhensis]KHF39937.1 hypothetical protein LQ50_12835 [Halalkalibacter okhensis]